MFDDLPPFMTVVETAKVLQIGRTKAYELTVEWERSGGRSGLQWTFIVMLLPLLASAYLLFRALRTYPKDVASAAAIAEEPRRPWYWPEEQPQPQE